MKRTRTTRLLLMGLAPLALTACESAQDAQLYASAEECKAAGRLGAQECEAAYADAQAAHERVAPHYLDRADCVADFGEEQCAPARDGTGAFIPFLGGMLLGQALSGGGYGPQPIYRPRHGQWQLPDGGGLGTKTGDIKVKPSVVKPQTRAITVSRAGFGSRAAARGSWGG